MRRAVVVFFGLALAIGCAVAPSPGWSAIEEVVVTAQRREQNIQDVPIAMSAFSEEALEARQVDEPLDIVNQMPNMFGGNNTGLGTANAYYLRGLGNTESIATFDPPVGTYVNNVYIARQNGNNVSFFDVDRIEVLRGPQGTLFGRNTTGGAVAIHMKKPAEAFGAFLEVAGGDFDRFSAQGSVDMPISDALLSKFSAVWVDEKGYVKNRTTGDDLNGQEAHGLRADFRLLPGDDLTWDFSAEYIDNENLNIVNGVKTLSVFQRPQDNGVTRNTTSRFSQTGIRAATSKGTLEQLAAGEGLGNHVESWALSSDMVWDTDAGSLQFITAFRNLEQDCIIDFFDGAGLLGGFTIANAGEHQQFTQELKYANTFAAESLDLVAGLFYFDERNSTDFSDVFALPFGNLLLADREIDNDTFSFAAYAQADFHVNERLTLTAGARWTKEEKTFAIEDFKPGLVGNNPFNNVLAFPAAPDAELSTANLEAFGIDTELEESILTPRVAAQYRLTETFMAFVSYTEGFKSGGWNARGNSAAELVPFEPERVHTWEAGFRSDWLDNSLRLNVTAFIMEAQDFQVPSAFVRPDNSIAFITQNFADLENEGVEIDLSWAPSDNLSLYLAAGLQGAEQIPGAAIREQRQRCLAGAGGGGQGIVDPSCEIAEPTRSPDYTLMLGGTVRFPMPAINSELAWSFNLRRTDDLNVGTSGLANGLVEDSAEVTTGLALRVGDNLRFVLECTNCTDALVQHSVLAGTTYYNEPRRITFKARRDF